MPDVRVALMIDWQRYYVQWSPSPGLCTCPFHLSTSRDSAHDNTRHRHWLVVAKAKLCMNYLQQKHATNNEQLWKTKTAGRVKLLMLCFILYILYTCDYASMHMHDYVYACDYFDRCYKKNERDNVIDTTKQDGKPNFYTGLRTEYRVTVITCI